LIVQYSRNVVFLISGRFHCRYDIYLSKYSGTCAIRHPVTPYKNLWSQSISVTVKVLFFMGIHFRGLVKNYKFMDS
jgi:hypothetical protein